MRTIIDVFKKLSKDIDNYHLYLQECQKYISLVDVDNFDIF